MEIKIIEREVKCQSKKKYLQEYQTSLNSPGANSLRMPVSVLVVPQSEAPHCSLAALARQPPRL
jgi:hypothetical protein